MKDVAAAAGVSATTVSFVINDAPGVKIPEPTRQRVWAAVERLGYRPNAVGRALRRSRTDTIGLISDVVATTPFAGEMIQGAQDAAWERQNVLLLVSTGGDVGLEHRAIETMVDRQVDGILYATMYHRVVSLPEPVRGVPVVMLDAESPDASLPSVVPDEQDAAFQATAELLDRGHRRVGMLNNVDPIPATASRLLGYRRALESRGLEFDDRLVRAGVSGQGGGFDAALQLLSDAQAPSGLFCFNDRMAMGAYQAAAELGRSVPRDVAIVGFDDMELIAPWLRPALTTVALPHYEMGRWAVEHLFALIDDGDQPAAQAPVQHRMPCRLVRRSSV
jgi:LacI family transcriptional regulator